MDSIPYALFLYLISGKMQKSNVTSFLRVVLKKLARKLVRKKVKKVAFDPRAAGGLRIASPRCYWRSGTARN